MSKSSTGVIIARIAIIVVILGAIIACICFFVLRNNNSKLDLFSQYNSVMYSSNQNEVDEYLGDFESGDYYSYSISHDLDFQDVYIEYYANKKIAEAYSYLLIYTENSNNRLANEINDLLNDYSNQLTVLYRSQELHYTTSKEYGNNPTEEQQQAILTNFRVIIDDFSNLTNIQRQIIDKVFTLVTESYYSQIDAFSSLQYTFTYALNKQAGLVNQARNDNGLSDDLYADTKAMIRTFNTNLNTGFVAQSTNSNMQLMISYFQNEAYNHFDDLLNSADKATYVNSIEDATLKNRVQLVMNCLGLQGRY